MTQGKTNKQIKDSKNLVKLGYSGIILLVIIMVMVDMNCGDYDSINTYTTFYDVPVTQDSLIIVDAILYRKGKEQWTPVYPDEYVMWITAEGDTIWE